MLSIILEKISSSVIIVLTVIVLAFIFAIILSYPVMLLWNWLMPMIFGLIQITFWQSFGILLLSNLLFKSSK